MTRRRLIFFCALVLVAAGVVALWPSGPKEPVFQGRKLSEWIRIAGLYPTNSQTEHARVAINAIGTNAIPYLLSEFSARESRLAPKLAEWVSRKTGFDFGFDEGNPRRGMAVVGLSFLGTNAAPALPALATNLTDEENCVGAAWVMGECGEMALPYLLTALTSTNLLNWYVVIHALGSLTAQTDAAIPPLVQLTQHTNHGFRALAAANLSKARSRMDLVIPALGRLLSDSHPSVQLMATDSLIRMRERAKGAIPDLLVMLQDTNLTRASWASNALYKIDPSALPRAAAP